MKKKRNYCSNNWELIILIWLEALFQDFSFMGMDVPQIIMVLLALCLAYMSIVKKYEPLLLLPLSFGMLIANVPLAGLSAYDEGGLVYYLYKGIELGIYPPLIFLCIGAMTDFGPLIASPMSALIGLGGQLGIFVATGGALLIGHIVSGIEPFTLMEAAAIGMIGSSDGPTSIYTAGILAPNLLPVITIAAYSYMALVPLIQPPIMRALTTKKERLVEMPNPKRVTRRKKIIFAFGITIATLVLVPAAGSLISMLMLGNLIRESGVTERYVRTLQNHLLNVLTLLLGVSIGATATAERILNVHTIIIICMGLLAFAFGTVGGILIAKLLCKVTGGKVNPLIGNSGVSAMPMAARVSQRMGQYYNPQNHLLMHAMGPIVSSTIGSAIVAGLFIAYFGF
jgi:oxaloacetate decarboxylase beta subunit